MSRRAVQLPGLSRFHKLCDQHALSMPQGPQGQSHARRGLALPVPVIQMQSPFHTATPFRGYYSTKWGCEGGGFSEEKPPPSRSLPKRRFGGDAGGEAASLREAPLPQTPSPEEWMGIGLCVPTDLCAHAAWARFPVAWLWSRRLTEPPRPAYVLRKFWGRGRFSKRSASTPTPLSRRVDGNRLVRSYGLVRPCSVGAVSCLGGCGHGG